MSDKEDLFLLIQQLDRAQLRCREGRARDVDVLLLNTDWRPSTSSDPAYVVEDRTFIGEAVELADLDELILLCSVKDQLLNEYFALIKQLKQIKMDSMIIDSDIDGMIEDMCREDLIKLQSQIAERLNRGDTCDVEYWRHLEKRLQRRLLQIRFNAITDTLLERRKTRCPNFTPLSSENFTSRSQPSNEQGNPINRQWNKMVRRFTPRADCIPLTTLVEAPREELILPNYAAFILLYTKWTRQNERRHDSLNPPPSVHSGLKVIADYRLLERTQTPTFSFRRSKVGGNRILVLCAPHSYAPLLFEIPNIPWDCSSRQGFVFTFDKCILCLKVKFKRQ